VQNRELLIVAMEPVLVSKSSQEWLSELEELTIGCGPINTVEQVFDDPHIRDRGMVINMPHEALAGREIPLVASPLRLSATPVTYRHSPPVLGSNTEDVLREELGLDEASIETLRTSKII
jgi:crotonobetainyl-CoA:carnitine CoA-transferase CaiB-like acyl-CoA transferase